MTEIDLNSITDDTPSSVFTAEGSFIDKAGIKIIVFLLWVLVGILLFFSLIYFTHTSTKAHVLSSIAADDSTFYQLKFKTIASEYKEDRDFIISIVQLLLINFLLPIITALLGYIFGTSQRKTGD